MVRRLLFAGGNLHFWSFMYRLLTIYSWWINFKIELTGKCFLKKMLTRKEENKHKFDSDINNEPHVYGALVFRASPHASSHWEPVLILGCGGDCARWEGVTCPRLVPCHPLTSNKTAGLRCTPKAPKFCFLPTLTCFLPSGDFKIMRKHVCSWLWWSALILCQGNV